MIEPSKMFDDLKTKLKSAWMAGDYGEVANYTQPHAIDFASRRSIAPGMKVLDIACGTGNVTLPLAAAGADAIGVDIATNLIEQARRRAAAEGIAAKFEEADAEELPYKDEQFDLVVSMYGAMFALHPDAVVSEALRVCAPDGQFVMANWTPGGFMGKQHELMAQYSPFRPDSMASPLLWGDECTVHERFRDRSAQIELTPVRVFFNFPFGTAETVEFFRLFHGPIQRAFMKLDRSEQESLRAGLERLWAEHNQANDGTTLVEAEYLEVVAGKRG